MSLSVILFPLQGKRIQFTISNLLRFVVNAQQLLIEGQCYKIVNATVSAYEDCQQFVEHPFKLNFCFETDIQKIGDAGIPQKAFKFVTFDQLLNIQNTSLPVGMIMISNYKYVLYIQAYIYFFHVF